MLQGMDGGERYNLIGEPVLAETTEPVFERVQLERIRDNLTNSGACRGLEYRGFLILKDQENEAFSIFDLSTARPKWRLDGPSLSGHLLYPLVKHAYANRYHHHLVR